MASTMSWPFVCSDVQLLVQVSPPSSSSVRPAGRRGCLHDGGDAIEAAHAPVGLRQLGEVLIGERVGLGRFRRKRELLEEGLAGDVGNDALGFADADVHGRLAEVQRHELAVDVRHVHERDVAETARTLSSSSWVRRPCAAARPKDPPIRADVASAACRNSRLEIMQTAFFVQRGTRPAVVLKLHHLQFFI